MLPLIPIVVGVTGKRDLKGKKLEIQRRLDEMLVEVEGRFPSSPLVLATGLAKGADLLAAEVALKRPSKRWTVVGVLALKQELFLEDFNAEEDLEWRETLRWLFETADRSFVLKVLRPLRSASGKPFEDKELQRTSDNPARRRHYEQAGLFIADKCGLLLALMPIGEEPGKVGGTARIARYKRKGKFDEKAASVAQDSEEIALPEPLDCEMRGLVQVLDLDGKQADGAPGHPNVAEERYAWLVLDRIEAFNKNLRGSQTCSGGVTAASQLLDAKQDDAPGDYLSRLRRELSKQQGRAKSRLSWSMLLLAGLFVCSIATLEIFAKIAPEARWLFFGYAVIVAGGLALFYLVQKKRLQAIVEDYRAAAEALRVQVEWWRLGLRGPTHHVDRYYLVGGEGHFAVLRGGIKGVIDAAMLLDPNAAPPGRALEVHPEEKGLKRGDFWIPSQIDFFDKRSDSRHRSAIRWSSAAWYLFQLSVGVGVAIGGLMVLRGAVILEPVLGWVLEFISEHRKWLPITTVGSALWAALFLIWVRAPQQSPVQANATLWQRIRHLLWFRRLLGTRGRHSGKHGWAIALILGFLMVPAVLAHILDQGTQTTEALYRTEKISLVLMILLAAASGAARFVLERRAIEAEAVSYRETLQRFKAAQDRATESRTNVGAGADMQAMILKHDQELGLALGRVALAENEAWLRAHRQRPFEPLS